MTAHDKIGYNISRLLISIFGLLFILAALTYNEYLLVLLDSDPPIDVETLSGIRRVQIIFFVTGFVLIVLSNFVIRRVAWLDSFTRKDSVSNILLVVLPVLSLITLLELSLQPFADIPKELTTIFIKDSELGCKLNPNAKDMWGGVQLQ